MRASTLPTNFNDLNDLWRRTVRAQLRLARFERYMETRTLTRRQRRAYLRRSGEASMYADLLNLQLSRLPTPYEDTMREYREIWLAAERDRQAGPFLNLYQRGVRE